MAMSKEYKMPALPATDGDISDALVKAVDDAQLVLKDGFAFQSSERLFKSNSTLSGVIWLLFPRINLITNLPYVLAQYRYTILGESPDAGK